MMTRRLLRLLPLFALVGILAFGVTSNPHARAQNGVGFQISPNMGAADQQRLFEFDGFSAGETVQLTFTDPFGQPVTVRGYATFDASAQDDGSGAFFFRPAGWLDSFLPGMWTVTITGQQSGASASDHMMITF